MTISRNLRVFGAALLAALTLAAPARAQEQFYIEVGHADSEEEALAGWQVLSEKHPSIIGKLKVYPQTVLRRDGKLHTRVQAGPITQKKEALRICAKLFAKDVPCFVLEGLTEAPAQKAMEMSSRPLPVTPPDRREMLPWQVPQEAPARPVVLSGATEDVPPPAPVTFEPPPLTPLSEIRPEPMEKPAPVSAAKGEVEVAEAIRVPLSDETDMKKSPGTAQVMLSLEDSKPATQPRPMGSAKKSSVVGPQLMPGWLNIEYFPTEMEAAGLWQQVLDKDPSGTSGLRIRISRPAADYGQASIALGIGPFADREDAMAFCLDNIKPLALSLHCRFQRDESRRRGSRMMAAPYEHGQDYEERRKALQSTRRGDSGPEVTVADNPAPQYWVRLAQAGSRDEAMTIWENLRTEHGDLMAGVRSGITGGAGGKGSYLVRVGPFKSQGKAEALHNALKDRGINSHIYSSQTK